ncbi:hypothetical protein HYU40_03740 [Candidatus Woesearchaeota archaeon]|nr:hypothetical protein [Candidatus Woesearchaeota archaeon]
MSEKKLVVACVIVAAAGIFTLLFLSSVLQPLQLPVSKASELACSKTGNSEKVRILGFIDSVSIRSNHALITVSGSETIEAISFDTAQVKELGLKRFQRVEITGQLRNYNGKPSLVITKLRQVNGSYGCSCGG